MNATLEPEVALALERAGLRARRVHALARNALAGSGRSRVRIELDAGPAIKARRLEDEATASRLFAIRQQLPDAFARVLARHGRVLLEEWIEGTELADACPAPATLAEAGALLGSLHARSKLLGEALHERRSTREWRERSEADLRWLVAAGALGAGEAEATHAALARLDPGSAVFGLVHSDFCGENLVIDAAGRLRVIDNERLRVDALGFDLARTWYRWPLPEPAWRLLRDARAAALPFAETASELAFWQRVVLIKSATLRLRSDPARAHVPLARLSGLARAPAAAAGS